MIKVKVLTLGESAVGKSSILVRYTDNKFSASHVTTLGVEYKQKKLEINDQNVLLQVWDTAGQERFKTITPVYYKSVQGVILVFSITDKDSFENVQYWMGDLKKHSDIDKIKIVLVGNKSDLDQQRVVSREEAEETARQLQCQYFEASAKTNENINEVFNYIASEIIQRLEPQNKTNTKITAKDTKPKKGGCCN